MNPLWLPNITACSFVTAYTTLLNYPFFNFSPDWKQNYQLIVCKIYFLPLFDICSDICTCPAADSTPFLYDLSKRAIQQSQMLVFSGPYKIICLGQKTESANLRSTFLLPIFTLPFLIWRWFSLPKMMEAKGRAREFGGGWWMNSRMLDSGQNMWSLES